MAPHTGFKTDEIKEKARKDLLYLLEGVSKDYRTSLSWARHKLTLLPAGSWEEESGT